MSEEPLSRWRRIVRAAILFPIVAGGGIFMLWTMSMVPKVADRFDWPTWVIAFLMGLVVFGPARLVVESLTNRLLALLALPELRAAAGRSAPSDVP